MIWLRSASWSHTVVICFLYTVMFLNKQADKIPLIKIYSGNYVRTGWQKTHTADFSKLNKEKGNKWLELHYWNVLNAIYFELCMSCSVSLITLIYVLQVELILV